MILLKSCVLYSPQSEGKKDILIAGGKIISIQNSITLPSSKNMITLHSLLTSSKALPIESIDVENKITIPGLVGHSIHTQKNKTISLTPFFF